MNYKKITATLLTAVLVVANCVPALAASGNASGEGIVEYDNSKAIAYDSVTVPTMVADATYAFEIDPEGLLKGFGGEGYETGTVYFTAIDDPASVAGKTTKTESTTTTVTLYKKTYVAQEASSGKWSGVVKTWTDSQKEVNDGFFVWTPLSTAPSGFTGGTSGEYTALTSANITNWFSVEDDKSIKLLPNYKAGTNVCDGKLYKATYTALTDNKVEDSVEDPISNYVTLGDANAVTAVANLYKNTATSGDPVYAEATKDDVTYTAATAKHCGTSNIAKVINKSTKAKTVKVTVTLSNATGLTIKNSNSFTDDNNASIYVAAMNGSTAVPLAEDNGVVKAEFTADIAAATDAGETLYQTDARDEKTGGHIYKRYTGPAPSYTNHSFSLTAAANNTAGAKDAWKAYSKAVTAATKPSINVVYDVSDYVEAPTTYTVTYNANYEGADPATATETVEVGSNPEGPETAFEREGYHQDGWLDDAEGDAVDLDDVTSATTLYANWVEDVVAPTVAKTSYSKTEYGTSGVEITFNPGTYTDGITAVKWSSSNDSSASWAEYGSPAAYYTIDDNTIEVGTKIFTSPGTRYWRVYFADDVYVTLTFTMD
ncbi:MAG: hypothetical protein IK111_08310 [Lachnospiraceae bacterium]|nr:hypothetical protein [Lachnospiraceae bacterium]